MAGLCRGAILCGLLAASSLVFASGPQPEAAGDEAAILHALEEGRATRNEAQLRSVAAELERRIASEPGRPQAHYLRARALGYLVDALVARKDSKAATASVDEAIAELGKSLALEEGSSDAHSLLADLYGRRIGLSGFMGGAKYGHKVGDENQRALELDPKNPRAWASLGRQRLQTPKMFGGDIDKAIESFKKSLELDPGSDETWFWLALAYRKQGDSAQALQAAQRARELNPASVAARELVEAIQSRK